MGSRADTPASPATANAVVEMATLNGGLTNGASNGIANGHINGVANGHANGVANGRANGGTSGDISGLTSASRPSFVTASSKLMLLQDPEAAKAAAADPDRAVRRTVLLRFENLHKSIEIEKVTPYGPFGLIKRYTKEKKEVLRGVSGVVRPGELVALMGPSGTWRAVGVLLGAAYAHAVALHRAPVAPAPPRERQDDAVEPALWPRPRPDPGHHHAERRAAAPVHEAHHRVRYAAGHLLRAPHRPGADHLHRAPAPRRHPAGRHQARSGRRRHADAGLGSFGSPILRCAEVSLDWALVAGAQVEEVIQELGLGKCADTKISMVSGGTRRMPAPHIRFAADVV